MNRINDLKESHYVLRVVKKRDQRAEVGELQRLLVDRGYPVELDRVFGPQTYRAVKAFQSQNLDPHGQPLIIDGVGPLTWWSLTHPKPDIATFSAVDYTQMPPDEAGGSQRGRLALAASIGELRAGAGEEGGDNRGPWVRKYLNGLANEGSSWCAGLVSWCYSQHPGGCPFNYTVGARKIFKQFEDKRWSHLPGTGYEPKAGGVVVWWREQLAGWKGHVGLVHQLHDGMLYTIEGNKSPKVQGFSYVFSRMDQLLGFGQVPNV